MRTERERGRAEGDFKGCSVCGAWRCHSVGCLHPSSFILHPSSFILHPSSFILYPCAFFLPSSSLILPSCAIYNDPSFLFFFLRTPYAFLLPPSSFFLFFLLEDGYDTMASHLLLLRLPPLREMRCGCGQHTLERRL